MSLGRKLAMALALYAVLALLAWQTLTEEKLRLFVWVLLGFFAVRSLLHWRHEAQSPGDHGRE